MGRVGKYTYPEEPLGDVIEYLHKIRDFFGEKNITGELPREAIAEAWNLSYGSGTFNTRIASLIHYGFAEKSSSGTIKLTKLALDLLYPDPLTNSDQEARRKAFFNVQLFKDIYEQLGDSPTVEQVKWFLRQKSNAEPPIVENKAPKIHKIYIESVTEISIEKGEELPVSGKAGEILSEVRTMPQVGEEKIREETPIQTKTEEVKLSDIIEIRFPRNNKEMWKRVKKIVDVFLGVEEEQLKKNENLET